MSTDKMAPLGDGRPAQAHTQAWLETLDAHAMEHGFHARLGRRHGALYTEDDDAILLVTFEDATAIRATTPALPYGLKCAGKQGWSQLTLYSDGPTWFRDRELYAFFDDLVDDGFFDLFDTVLFYGAGAGGYAACAYSVAAPGARVLAIRPQATLDPRFTGWDRRFLGARRLSFTERYGNAAELLDAAEQAFVVYDPMVLEDAMHAALFGTRAHHLRTPYFGAQTERELEACGMLEQMLRLAVRNRLDPQTFASLYRRRHAHAAYLQRVMAVLEAARLPARQAVWCRAALRTTDCPVLRAGLARAEAALATTGRSLPPAHAPAHAPAAALESNAS
ncbi:MAG: phosphoadenosine phosphosulfate reductase [Pseudomonadota bacterium]